MSEPFKILIDRLKGGRIEPIDEAYDPSFFGVEEPELRFPSKVNVKGEVYLTDDHLILRLKAKASALMPCAICNQMIQVELKVDDFYHAQPIEEISGAIFDFSEPLREALLIELPKYVECKGGKCPERAILTPYLRPEAAPEKTTHFPFADIDLN